MAVFDDGDKIKKWRYRTSALTIAFPSVTAGIKTKEIPVERVKSISIVYDYEKLMFPVLRLEVAMGSKLYYKILKNKDDARFYLRVQKYYHYSDKSDKSLFRDYINDVFELILDDDDNNMQSSIKNTIKNADYNSTASDDDDEDETNTAQNENICEFFLFNAQMIASSKVKVNTILESCTLTDAVAWIASKGNINNILMSPADNHKKYDTIVIPPLTVTKAIQWIDTYYGLYKKGSIFFYDFNYTYLLSYDGKCTAYHKDEKENVSVIIPSVSSSHSTECGELKKKKAKANENKIYMIGDCNNMSVRNDNETYDVLYGSDITTVDADSGDVTTTTNGTTSKNGNTVRIFENYTENSWVAQTYTAQTAALKTVVDLTISDIDVSKLSPNKRYTLLFEDTQYAKKYKGSYLLSSATYTFMKDASDFSVDAKVTFKKSK